MTPTPALSLSMTEKQARFEYLTSKLVIGCFIQGLSIICYRYRSTLADDLAYFHQGLSEIDPTKTPTKHMLGLAKDYAIAKGVEYDWADIAAYTKMGELAESLGLRWGGRWKLGDFGHVEYQEGA
jgi:hypothetical protein